MNDGSGNAERIRILGNLDEVERMVAAKIVEADLPLKLGAWGLPIVDNLKPPEEIFEVERPEQILDRYYEKAEQPKLKENGAILSIVDNKGHTEDIYRGELTHLINTITEAKAFPEAMWVSPSIRFIDREYINVGGNMMPAFIVVTETPPGMHNLTLQENFHRKRPPLRFNRRALALPYLVNVFVFRINDLEGRIELDTMWPLSFYRTTPLSGFSDELLMCNLPNVNIIPWNPAFPNAAIGWTCFHGADAEDISVIPYKETYSHQGESDLSAVSRATDKVLSYYLNAAFTGSEDTSSAWRESSKRVAECKTIEDWERNSAENPDFVYGADWLPHPERATLGDVIASIHSGMEAVPHEGFINGEPTLMVPDGVVTKKRIMAVLGMYGKKLKFW